mgnify:CR=1 FL=1
MAWVTARTWHPEPSVALPRLQEDLTRDMGAPLTPQGEFPRGWPIDSWAFPRDVPRPVPAWVGLWLCGLRRREGPWFEVRLERGEWQRLYPHAIGLIPEWDRPLAGLPRGPWESPTGHVRARRRWRRRQRKERARRLRRGAPRLKARHFLALWPDHAEAFVRGCRGRYTVMNTEGYEATYDAAVSPKPMTERGRA